MVNSEDSQPEGRGVESLLAPNARLNVAIVNELKMGHTKQNNFHSLLLTLGFVLLCNHCSALAITLAITISRSYNRGLFLKSKF